MANPAEDAKAKQTQLKERLKKAKVEHSVNRPNRPLQELAYAEKHRKRISSEWKMIWIPLLVLAPIIIVRGFFHISPVLCILYVVVMGVLIRLIWRR